MRRRKSIGRRRRTFSKKSKSKRYNKYRMARGGIRL